MKGALGLRVRWSWRDLRRRWVLVAALAFIIALGTGAFAGLGGTSQWRIRSNDASYAALRMHDLKVTLPDGVFVPAGRLARAAAEIPDASAISAAEERLIVSTQVDASIGEQTVLVPGEVVGMPAAAQAASVDSLHVVGGRGSLVSAGQPTAVLESKFAADHHLPATGRLVLSGSQHIAYVGTGYTPEYFRVVGRSGQLLGESGFAVVFMSLSGAQAASGHPGMVNDLVLRLAPGANRAEVQNELASSVSALGGEVSTRDDDPVYTGLYADARNDQQTWNAFALLILLGAGFAAFNLVTRLIDAQRRELGVGMALGVPPWRLATRPLLVGVQVAVGGVAAGVAVGWLLSLAMRNLIADLIPLPIWLTPFPTGRFLQAAGLGLAIPILATLLPLRRVLRLQPVDAIRTGAYGGGGAGSGRIGTRLRRVRLPGRTYRTMPLRNVLRAPRRTLLTALGVAAAVTSLVAVLGMLDSFAATGDRSTAEIERMNGNRLTVTLSTFLPEQSAQVRAITSIRGISAAEPELQVPTRISAHGHELDAVTVIMDLHNRVWTPSLSSGDPATAARGILLSEKAAADLHVRVGDTVQLRHPIREGLGYRLVTTPIVVGGLHPNPLRPLSYLAAGQANLFGLSGLTNVLTVVPAQDTTTVAVTRALFSKPGVASVEPATGFAQLLDRRLGEFTGVLRVIELVTLLLALLIAFNTASLSADERAREYATMFAFGLRTRAVTLMAIVENALIGIVGTLLGAALGFVALHWLLSGLDEVMPELSITATLSGRTWATTLVLGVLVVALAPLLNTRRLQRMDIPATLRVVE